MSRDSTFATVRRRLLGLALLLCVALFLSVTVATYQGVFRPSVDVVLRAASTGNQLMPDSEVKVRGMTVGRVDEVRPTDEGAELHLALEPDKARLLPANVSARLLPRTLFGERYVSLDVPEQASSTRLAAGDVISQDRTRASVELETVLADTMPVLQAVHPDDLAVTLNSLDQALDGRGEEVGDTITRLNQYVEGLNPSLPQLQENLRQLVGVAETYEQAAPDVLQALGDLSVTSRTLVAQQQDLRSLTSQLTTASNDATGFLEASGDDLIRLGESSRPTADVLAKYSPQYPCLLRSLTGIIPLVDDVFGVGTDEPGAHVTLEVVPPRGEYVPGEEPSFDDERGPRCYDYPPGTRPQYPPDGPIQDGSTAPAPADAPGAASSGGAGGLGLINSPQERDAMSTVLAPSMGVPASTVPQWGSMLVGPVLRGAEVSYR
ncbi:MCE family protein [Saccharopolyspora gloriosae]|uniref:Virulence factor Mce-like protein n=1 Tax=Saccharopolyspora gloriosae TaxID=455344 RepID=A0A840NLY9_9PSEU|nr:MCE family protein [Saccharopolyspora gloriosae]MBB5069267.1 virulence factor Mce-like protein [Saccharopolyspora gloriosae]